MSFPSGGGGAPTGYDGNGPIVRQWLVHYVGNNGGFNTLTIDDSIDWRSVAFVSVTLRCAQSIAGLPVPDSTTPWEVDGYAAKQSDDPASYAVGQLLYDGQIIGVKTDGTDLAVYVNDANPVNVYIWLCVVYVPLHFNTGETPSGTGTTPDVEYDNSPWPITVSEVVKTGANELTWTFDKAVNLAGTPIELEFSPDMGSTWVPVESAVQDTPGSAVIRCGYLVDPTVGDTWRINSTPTGIVGNPVGGEITVPQTSAVL